MLLGLTEHKSDAVLSPYGAMKESEASRGTPGALANSILRAAGVVRIVHSCASADGRAMAIIGGVQSSGADHGAAGYAVLVHVALRGERGAVDVSMAKLDKAIDARVLWTTQREVMIEADGAVVAVECVPSRCTRGIDLARVAKSIVREVDWSTLLRPAAARLAASAPASRGASTSASQWVAIWSKQDGLSMVATDLETQRSKVVRTWKWPEWDQFNDFTRLPGWLLSLDGKFVMPLGSDWHERQLIATPADRYGMWVTALSSPENDLWLFRPEGKGWTMTNVDGVYRRVGGEWTQVGQVPVPRRSSASELLWLSAEWWRR